ncbi:MAG: ferritin-like domain-containing protein [Verrucomicrobiota bacterium]
MNNTHWIRHFTRNQLRRPEPDWAAPLDLPEKVRRPLVKSLEQFQLGDGGGPAYLIAHDRGGFLKDEAIKELVDLWFREEKEHARLLGDALKRFGGTPIDDHWSFSLFCGLRKHLGVRFELTALLLTEIVSNVYYKMLHRHGRDVALRQMCRLIIRDETGHIAFHRARLADEGKGIGLRKGLMFRLLGLGAGTALWMNHRKAVVAMGGTTFGFYRTIWKDMSRFVGRVNRDVKRAGTKETRRAPELVCGSGL